MGNVRRLDADRPDLIARATRLSNLYGTSVDSELARKGAGHRYRRRRAQLRLLGNVRQGCYGRASSPDLEKGGVRGKAFTRKGKLVLRGALKKAEQAALRYNLDCAQALKAYDGPPLAPGDVKDLLLRSFRIKLTTPEAVALVVHFSTSLHVHREEDLRIEVAEFLHAIQRLRRNLNKRSPVRGELQTCLPSLRGDGHPSAPSLKNVCSSGSLHKRCLGSLDSPNMLCPRDAPDQMSLNMEVIVRALAKVDRAATAYDRRRIQSLREADLTRATSPRAFGGVLLARFDVRVNTDEQQELVALLQDKNGMVDVERFRTYFVGLVDGASGACTGGHGRPAGAEAGKLDVGADDLDGNLYVRADVRAAGMPAPPADSGIVQISEATNVEAQTET